MAAVRFLRSNLGYLIWFIFYFMIAWSIIGGNWNGFFLTALIYGVSITIALSPIGEVLLQWFQNIRPVQTQQEKDYLFPIFEEVYQNAKEMIPRLRRNVKLYIDDTMTVNAFAIGRKTIALTRGAIATFSPAELKGVLAHEFGHLVNGDTKALLLNVIGNGFFTLIILFLRIIILIVRTITGAIDKSGVISLVFRLIDFVFNIYVFLLVFVGQLILSSTSRQAEYFADYFSYEIGFSDELIQALYLLQKTSIPANVPLMERLKASHPNLAGRIARLEKLR